MKKKRSILCCLLCMLLSLFGAFSSYAYSVASKSNADYYMHNAQEFVPNYVPISSDLASKSDADIVKLTSPALRAASGVTEVVNTVDLSECHIRCHTTYDDNTDSRIPGSYKKLGTDGTYSWIGDDSQRALCFVIHIPKYALPQSGKYLMSYSYMSHVAYSYNNIQFRVYKNVDNADQNYQTISAAFPDNQDNAGQFSRSPVLIDFTNVSFIDIVCFLGNGQQAIGGRFHMRFKVSNETSGAVDVGYSQPDQSASAAQTAQNTSELVYSQNETNGLLHDIIQHISDQLAAMWDQLYNLMAVPWIQNDNQRTNNTIEAIEENSQDTQTTIEEQTQWHGNFIIEGLKGLFIPDDDYFESVRTDLSSWFEEHFGFLAQAINYFIRILNVFISTQKSDSIRFPAIQVPNVATGETYVIMPARTVSISQQIQKLGSFTTSDVLPDYDMSGTGFPASFNLASLSRYISRIILTLYLVQMFIDKLHKIEGM